MKYFAFYCHDDGFSLDSFENMEELSEFLSSMMNHSWIPYTLDESEDVERGRIICIKGEYIKPKPAEKVTVWQE